MGSAVTLFTAIYNNLSLRSVNRQHTGFVLQRSGFKFWRGNQSFVGVAQSGQSDGLQSRASRVRILAPAPKYSPGRLVEGHVDFQSMEQGSTPCRGTKISIWYETLYG